MRYRSHTFVPLVLVLLSPILMGCLHSQDLTNTQRLLEQEHSELSLEREINLNLGFFSLRTLSLLTRVGGAELDDARALLPHMKRVKVGVYNVTGAYPNRHVDLPGWEHLQRKGWQQALHQRGSSETTWVLYRERRDAVRDVFIFHLDHEQLVLLQLRGDLDRILAHVLSDTDNVADGLRRVSASH